jgi:thiamine kinase-like enzyme
VDNDVDRALDTVAVLAAPRDVKPLPGGLMNQSYAVTTRFGGFVARMSSTHDVLIDRDAEYRNALRAAECGAGPTVVAYRPDVGLLVAERLDGRTLTSADLSDPHVATRVIAAIRRLHHGPAFVGAFDIFAVLRRYLAVVQARGYPLPARYLDHLPQLAGIERALAACPQPAVPCHNDLVAANLIDDGDRVWIIDYEYAANNDAFFDFGNMWSDAGLPPEWLDDAVHRYYGAVKPDLVARARLYGMVANYCWTAWASIQDAVSATNFDFATWASDRYRRTVAELDGPELARLLRDVAM